MPFTGTAASFRTFARRLAENPELRRRMGAAGRERVAAGYAIERWAETIADILREARRQELY